MTDTLREVRLATAFVTLADTLVSGYDVVDLMHYLVDASVDLLDVAAAGLSLTDVTGRLELVASTGEHSELVELMQIRTGSGPCMTCFELGEPQVVADIGAASEQWPEFAALALQHGLRSVHAFPMRLRTRVIGAMNLFGAEVGTLNMADQRAAQALADIATIGVLHERAAHNSAELATRLQHALNSRVVIEQAKGLLASHGDIDMDQAFAALRGYARRHHLPLTELAEDIVERRRRTAEVLPVAPSSRAPARRSSDRLNPVSNRGGVC